MKLLQLLRDGYGKFVTHIHNQLLFLRGFRWSRKQPEAITEEISQVKEALGEDVDWGINLDWGDIDERPNARLYTFVPQTFDNTDPIPEQAGVLIEMKTWRQYFAKHPPRHRHGPSRTSSGPNSRIQ